MIEKNEKNDIHIEVPSDIEVVQLKPGVYAGSLWNPNQLAIEAIDNGIDEILNDFANYLDIKIDNDLHTCEITDNGNGIPVHGIKLDKNSNEIYDSIIVACTKLHSGAKFNNKNYSYSTGMHGVGLIVINALSLKFMVHVKKDDILYTYEFENGVLTSNLQYIISELEEPIVWSTKIWFQINTDYFSYNKIEIDKIEKKLLLIKSIKPKCNLIFNNEYVKYLTRLEYASLLLKKQKNKIAHINYSNKVSELDIYFVYANANDIQMYSNVFGDLNSLICTGTYLTNFETLFYNTVKKLFFKKHTIKKNVILGKLNAYISIKSPSLNFSGNVKSYMYTDLTTFFQSISNILEIELKQNILINQNIQNVIDNYILNIASKKIVKQKRVSINNTLIDCLNNPGEILYIVEGPGAGNLIKDFRDVYKEAIFPITGKLINVLKSSIDVATNSKRFKFLLEAIGIDIKNKNNQTNFRYNEISLIADSDYDGCHINVLVLIALWKYAPQLIKTNRVSIILPPLYGTTINGKFMPIYKQSELHKYNSWKRFKGLGEMDSIELEYIVRDPKYKYFITPPSTSDIEKSILSCITNVDVKRKLCDIKKFSFESLIQNIIQ
jgi:topoisomerase-4 subunit B